MELVASRKATADHFGEFVKLHPQVEAWYPTAMYNDMIHPLVPFAIRGALWHQGESDVGGPPDGLPYFEGMKALIGGWRKVWGEGDFPFYYVMTGPFRDWKNDDLPHHWMSQLAALSIPNTGYVVTTDCGQPWDLHPHNKDIVGHRLALWALAKTYGLPDLVYSGPLYKAAKIEGHGIRVSFDSVGGGLTSRDGKPLTHFEIAGADGVFVPAVARIEGADAPRHQRIRRGAEGRAVRLDVGTPQASGSGRLAELLSIKKGCPQRRSTPGSSSDSASNSHDQHTVHAPANH